MKTYIALFRGINVGGRNKLRMQELRGLLEDLGYKNVQTYIQSGNVVFDADKTDRSELSSDISKAVKERHGF